MPGRAPMKAHRMAWTLVQGPIPHGANVLHRCDIPHCTNAETHLFLGSLADNNRDMKEKGRGRGPSELTEEQVRDIRAARAAGATQRAVGKRFLVSQPTIHNIVHRKTWKHIL